MSATSKSYFGAPVYEGWVMTCAAVRVGGNPPGMTDFVFRNNVVHLFTASAWIACCFQHNRRMSRSAAAPRSGAMVSA